MNELILILRILFPNKRFGYERIPSAIEGGMPIWCLCVDDVQTNYVFASGYDVTDYPSLVAQIITELS